MGYYIDTSASHGKAEIIARELNGEILPGRPAWGAWPQDKALIVVVDNGLFEAAGYAYDEREYEAFTLENDKRPRQWVLIGREDAEVHSGKRASDERAAGFQAKRVDQVSYNDLA